MTAALWKNRLGPGGGRSRGNAWMLGKGVRPVVGPDLVKLGRRVRAGCMKFLLSVGENSKRAERDLLKRLAFFLSLSSNQFPYHETSKGSDYNDYLPRLWVPGMAVGQKDCFVYFNFLL